MKRFKITKVKDIYIILDRKKLKSCIPDKRYTHKTFSSRDMAEGYLVGKGK